MALWVRQRVAHGVLYGHHGSWSSRRERQTSGQIILGIRCDESKGPSSNGGIIESEATDCNETKDVLCWRQAALRLRTTKDLARN